MSTRTEQEMMDLILRVAREDDRVRAVLIGGSRAEPGVPKDKFQDFDIIYVVRDLASFTTRHEWIDVFGERLLLQMPKAMEIGDPGDPFSFVYLMLLQDRNRIDLTLYPADKMAGTFRPSGRLVPLLDKDHMLVSLDLSGEKDFLIRPPEHKEFADCCNEFWWVSTYVAKALWRRDIIYAMHMLNIPVRSMFLQMIRWHIGLVTDFSVPFGNPGKHMKDYLPANLYQAILSTYPEAEMEHIWNSLRAMADVFDELAKKQARSFGFEYNEKEAGNAREYLEWVRKGAI